MPATTCTERALLLLRHPVPFLPLSRFYPLSSPSTSSPFFLFVSRSFPVLFPFFLLSSQFSPTCSLFYFASFFRACRFSRYPDLLYFALMSINLSPFLTFIDANLLLCFYFYFCFFKFLICLSSLAYPPDSPLSHPFLPLIDPSK